MQKNKHLYPAILFSSFMFLQFIILRMANSAGRGFLEDERQEKIYVFIQLFVICGIALHAAIRALAGTERTVRLILGCVVGACAPLAAIMLFAPTDSAFYIAVSLLAVLCLGVIAGAVYFRMSEYSEAHLRTGACMGIGYSAALLLQFLFQLEYEIKLALALFALAALAALFVLLSLKKAEGEGAFASDEGVRPSKIASACVICAGLLLFTAFYNGYIHHLQIASAYTEYNVYTWPRLLMIPGMLLFGFVGDFKGGRSLPLVSLCFSVVALLNAVLASRSETYWLNMCLYYVSLSAAVAYYDLIFWRMASKSKCRALVSVAGRVLDSLIVIPFCFVSLSEASAGVVLALNIAALALVIVLMALNGDFNFDAGPPERADGTPDERFAKIGERYGLTPSELRVFRELVLTEDKQTVISERLNVKIRTVQANITRIYQKTGVTTRSGLVNLYGETKK